MLLTKISSTCTLLILRAPKPNWKILDFTATEAKIIRVFREHGAGSVSALANAAKLPRSTVSSALRKLHKRGLIRRVSKGYASVWRLVKQTKLKEEFDEAATSLGVISETERRKRDTRDIFGVRVSKTSEVKIYRGVQHVPDVYRYWFINSGAKRIYGAETGGAVLSWLKYVPTKATNQMNEEIKENGIIVEGVVTEDIKDAYRAFAVHDSAWPHTFGGRMQAIRLVPNTLLRGNLEFLIAKDTVLLNNWDEQVVITIEDKSVASFFKSLYDALYETGKTFDQNAFIRGLIKE